MRNSHLAVILGLWLALAACSKSTQDKTGQDLKAVGADTAAAAKDVANSSATKELGADIKQGTKEAADKTAEATKDAAAKLKDSAGEAGDKLKSGAHEAADKTKDAVDSAKH
ncbi:hypothetical protein [Phenylobacterium sp.]|jgi:hypothetical protein|uniref:hypothetical protein n=1 Tax=Phenylobacterium sp. TaxID=1871053 RepID=UPI002F3F06EA